MENATHILSELERLTFGITDYLLFAILLIGSVLIGVYFGFFSKQDNTTEYLMGGKKMTAFPVAMSLVASHISGISLLGVPSEVYQFGTQYAAVIFTSIISCTIVYYMHLPIFYKLQVTTVFEYLEQRFARPVRMFASLLYVLALVTYIPMVLYVPALAFAQSTGISLYYIAPVIGVVCVFYTTIGGLKAVIWADTIQLSLMTFSLFAILFIGIVKVGHISEIWRISDEGGRLVFFNMDPSLFVRNSFWGMVIGMPITWLGGLGISQGSIQKFLSVPTMHEAKKTIVIMIVGMLVIKACSIFTGLTMYAKYHDCDPITVKIVDKINQLLPYYVQDVAGHVPGLPGLFLAGLVGAGLSTMSACLNTVAGTIYEDFIDPWMPVSTNKEHRATDIMKVLVVILGTFCVMAVTVLNNLGDIFQVSLSLNGITSGPTIGIFTLGMLVPWATTIGAITGGITSLLFMSWMVIGTQWHMYNKKFSFESLPTSTDGCDSHLTSFLTDWSNSTTTIPTINQSSMDDEPFLLFKISFMWYPLIGTLIVMIIGTITSFVFGPSDLKTLNSDHFPPIIGRYFRPAEKYPGVTLHQVPTSLIISPEKEEL